MWVEIRLESSGGTGQSMSRILDEMEETGIRERVRELNRHCYLLERGLLCGPCNQ